MPNVSQEDLSALRFLASRELDHLKRELTRYNERLTPKAVANIKRDIADLTAILERTATV